MLKSFVILLLTIVIYGCTSTPDSISTPDSLSASEQKKISFVVIGDLPYTDEQEIFLASDIIPKIRVLNPDFVTHIGDFKSGSEACTDALLTQRRDQIFDIYPGHIFYTPGDNDWTDCDRISTNDPISELNRLDFIRSIFFNEIESTKTSSQKWDIKRQDNYPENAVWSFNSFLFATVHIVGTNNGRDEILLDDIAVAHQRVDYRDHANREWLTTVQNIYSAGNYKGVVLFTHSDVSGNKSHLPACNTSIKTKCSAAAQYKTMISDWARPIDAPVLFVHGSTSPFCLNPKFGDVPNLTRFNSAGDNVIVDASVVEITWQTSGKVNFSIKSLVGGNTPDICENIDH